MNYLIYLFVIFFLGGLDQLSKAYIAEIFDLGQSLKIIDKFFYITHVRNDGAGFSILKGQMTFFIIITIIAFILLFYLLIKSDTLISKLSYLLMIGGALGNFIDRIRFGYVVDFLDFKIFGYNFPVFNLADSFLTIGVGIMLLSILMENLH